MAQRPNPALRFAREGPLRVVGHIWWNDGGVWRRYLVRRHAWSDNTVVQELHLVDSSRRFCPACLAQDVVEHRATGQVPWFECRAQGCGVRWWEVDEPEGLAG